MKYCEIRIQYHECQTIVIPERQCHSALINSGRNSCIKSTPLIYNPPLAAFYLSRICMVSKNHCGKADQFNIGQRKQCTCIVMNVWYSSDVTLHLLASNLLVLSSNLFIATRGVCFITNVELIQDY